MKRNIFGIVYGLILTAFTVWLMLDTFVTEHVYIVVEDEATPAPTATMPPEETEVPTPSATPIFTPIPSPTEEIIPDTEPVSGPTNMPTPSPTDTPTPTPTDTPTPTPTRAFVSDDTCFYDGNIDITLTAYRRHDTDIYVADVILSSPEYLKTAFAKDSYGWNVIEKTSTIAKRKNAVLAINGDFYGTQRDCFVMRNGKVYRSRAEADREALVIYSDGMFNIIREEEYDIDELKDTGAVQILSFGPALLIGGEIQVKPKDEVGKAQASNPRTAIGIIDELHYVFLVSDGRTDENKGLSLYQLADFMKGLGVDIAYNLDGGGSSTMYFNGKVVNKPTSTGKSVYERSVSDIVYIGY